MCGLLHHREEVLWNGCTAAAPLYYYILSPIYTKTHELTIYIHPAPPAYTYTGGDCAWLCLATSHAMCACIAPYTSYNYCGRCRRSVRSMCIKYTPPHHQELSSKAPNTHCEEASTLCYTTTMETMHYDCHTLWAQTDEGVSSSSSGSSSSIVVVAVVV